MEFEKEVCICCGKDTDLESIRLNENNGFCQISRPENICSECFSENLISTERGSFLKIKDKLYYDRYYGCWERIMSQRQIDMIFNEDYYKVSRIFQSLL